MEKEAIISVAVEKSVSDAVAICVLKAELNEEAFKKKFLKNLKEMKKQVIDGAHFSITDALQLDGPDFCAKKEKFIAEVEACLPSKMKQHAGVVVDNLLMGSAFGGEDFSQAADEVTQTCD